MKHLLLALPACHPITSGSDELQWKVGNARSMYFAYFMYFASILKHFKLCHVFCCIYKESEGIRSKYIENIIEDIR